MQVKCYKAEGVKQLSLKIQHHETKTQLLYTKEKNTSTTHDHVFMFNYFLYIIYKAFWGNFVFAA